MFVFKSESTAQQGNVVIIRAFERQTGGWKSVYI